LNGVAPEESIRRVAALIADVVQFTPGDVDEDLLETGMLDSFALIELLTAIENEFELQLPLEDLDLEVLRSVRSIASYVDGLLLRA
jgi:acyl carrier protein